MVRLEREGDSFVLITGKPQPAQDMRHDINILVNALSELRNTTPDASKLKEGLSFIENSNDSTVRNEIRNLLKKALESMETGL